MQSIVKVFYTVTYESPAAGAFFLPGGVLDPADLLDGVGANTKLTMGVFIGITRPDVITGGVLINNGFDVLATVAGGNKPKTVTRVKGNLAMGQAEVKKTVKAKKLIDKGPVTFEMTTSGADAPFAYNADVSYYFALQSAARSRR